MSVPAPEPDALPRIHPEVAAPPPTRDLPPAQINLFTGEPEAVVVPIETEPPDGEERIIDDGIRMVKTGDTSQVVLSGFGMFLSKKSERLPLTGFMCGISRIDAVDGVEGVVGIHRIDWVQDRSYFSSKPNSAHAGVITMSIKATKRGPLSTSHYSAITSLDGNHASSVSIRERPLRRISEGTVRTAPILA